MVDDEWGRDPNVQMMRRVFRAMEEAQSRMLDEVGILPFDPRLKRWRQITLGLWEKCWGRMMQTGLQDHGEKAANLYTHCLSRVMGREDVSVAEAVLPNDKEVEKLIMEVLP